MVTDPRCRTNPAGIARPVASVVGDGWASHQSRLLRHTVRYEQRSESVGPRTRCRLTSGASAGRDSGSEGRVSALLGGWHDLGPVLCGCFRLLLGASLLEGLAGLLGHVLSRRLIGHGCSLVGSLASSAGSTVRLLRADDAGSRYGARHARGCGPKHGSDALPSWTWLASAAGASVRPSNVAASGALGVRAAQSGRPRRCVSKNSPIRRRASLVAASSYFVPETRARKRSSRVVSAGSWSFMKP